MEIIWFVVKYEAVCLKEILTVKTYFRLLFCLLRALLYSMDSWAHVTHALPQTQHQQMSPEAKNLTQLKSRNFKKRQIVLEKGK